MMNSDETRYFLAALVLVEKDEKILLIQESKIECRNKWFLPGGRAEPGELIQQVAIREAKEESGLDVELTGLLFLDQLSDPDPAGAGNRIRFVFLGNPAGGELKDLRG